MDKLWSGLSIAAIRGVDPARAPPVLPRWPGTSTRAIISADVRRMTRRPTRSISGPIIYGSVAVALATALLVGWIYIAVRDQSWAASNVWLLVAGIVSLATIITVLVLFAVFLARETLEVRRQTTFVDSVTHELRSPLSSLRLCLETLRRPELPAAQGERLHDMMRHDVERLAAFIDDILEATRVGHGGRRHAAVRIEVATLVNRCVASVGRRHAVDTEAIRVDVPESLRVFSDPTALEIVVKNLLDNAVKYSDRPIDIAISAHVDHHALRIEVVDHGIGIPKRALARVFDRFYRVDAEEVRARRGTGLGLFVVRALVRGMGGSLTAFSDGPGTGTKMTIVLPNIEAVGDAGAPAPPNASLEEAADPMSRV